MNTLAIVVSLCVAASIADRQLITVKYSEWGQNVTETIAVDSDKQQEVHKTYFKDDDGVEREHLAITDFSTGVIISYVSSETTCYIQAIDSGDTMMDPNDFKGEEGAEEGGEDGTEENGVIKGQVVEEDSREYDLMDLDPSEVPGSIQVICRGRSMKFESEVGDTEESRMKRAKRCHRKCFRRKICRWKRYCCRYSWHGKECTRYCRRRRCYKSKICKPSCYY